MPGALTVMLYGPARRPEVNAEAAAVPDVVVTAQV
jgi:hypothetical protein